MFSYIPKFKIGLVESKNQYVESVFEYLDQMKVEMPGMTHEQKIFLLWDAFPEFITEEKIARMYYNMWTKRNKELLDERKNRETAFS